MLDRHAVQALLAAGVKAAAGVPLRVVFDNPKTLGAGLRAAMPELR